VNLFSTTKTLIGQILTVIGRTTKSKMMKAVYEQLNNFLWVLMFLKSFLQEQSIYL